MTSADLTSAEAMARALVSRGTAARLVGTGSRSGLGRPLDQALPVFAAAGDTITATPREMIIEAEAGASWAAVEAQAAAHGQHIACEPPRLGRLYGATADTGGSVGGVVACGFAGSRRLVAGGLGDAVLGLEAITGHGETIHAGGRVMKNVTGYDLCRLMTGALGTLGALRRVVLKTAPRPRAGMTLVRRGLAAEAAVAWMRALARGSLGVTGLAWANAALTSELASELAGEPVGGATATLVRLEGTPEGVRARAAVLSADATDSIRLEGEAHEALWASIRDLAPFASRALKDHAVWRLMPKPTEAATTLAALRQAMGALPALIDWGGGLVHLACADNPDSEDPASAQVVRGIVPNALLLRAQASTRRKINPFPAPDPTRARILSALKHAFDPQGIFNPGIGMMEPA